MVLAATPTPYHVNIHSVTIIVYVIFTIGCIRIIQVVVNAEVGGWRQVEWLAANNAKNVVEKNRKRLHTTALWHLLAPGDGY